MRREFRDRGLHAAHFVLSIVGSLHGRLPIELRPHGDAYRLELRLQLGFVIPPRCEPIRVAGVPSFIRFPIRTHRCGRVIDEIDRGDLLQLRSSNAVGFGLGIKRDQLGACRGHFLTQTVAPDRWVDGNEVAVTVDDLIDESTLGTDAGAFGHFCEIGRTTAEAGSGHVAGFNRQSQSGRSGDQRAR